MHRIKRKRILITSFLGILVAAIGICCVVMEWGTAWYIIISIIFVGILIQSITEQRCPYCGKYALSIALWNVIPKHQVSCKKCGKSIDYDE